MSTVNPNAAASAAPAVSAPIRLSELASGCRARMHTALLRPEDCALLRALGLNDRHRMAIVEISRHPLDRTQAIEGVAVLN